ncbi:MAG: DNA methyltransferase [Anaerolineae bacterium]
MAVGEQGLQLHMAEPATRSSGALEGMTGNNFSAFPDAEARSQTREALHHEYRERLVDKPAFRQLVTYVPNKMEPIHSWFAYKEAFSRRLVEAMLNEFKATAETLVLDPFCGCGTTPLACQQVGVPAIGVDILEVAIFATRVKLRRRQEYDTQLLQESIERLIRTPFNDPEGALPDIRIIPRAFTPQTIQEIVFFKELISNEADQATRDFLLLGLISILEDVSFTSKDGQFLRLVDREIPPVRQVLARKLESMCVDLVHNGSQPSLFDNSMDGSIKAAVLCGDARELPLKPEMVDIVITSPPYLNRYDYSRIYTLELALHFVDSFEELKEVRHSLLRSHIEVRPADTNDVKMPALDEILANLEDRKLNNNRIPVMIKGYFEDMFIAIKEMYRVMRTGGRVALVVGNARFAGEVVPVDMMLSKLAEEAGFRTDAIWVTRYKGNSSQQMGRYGRRPVRESIILWQK